MTLTNPVAGALLGALALAFAGATVAAEMPITGSSTVANALMLPNEAAIEAQAGVGIQVVANGSGQGLADLLEGRSEMAMISAPLGVTLAKLAEKAPGLAEGADLVAHPMGEVLVAFSVHPSNPVETLTLAEIAGILAGETANWRELGGPDMPIVVVLETAGNGTRSLVEHMLLDGAPVVGNTRVLNNQAQVPGVVAQMPPALGISSVASAAAASVRLLATDGVVAQPLILVTRGAPVGETAALIEAVRRLPL